MISIQTNVASLMGEVNYDNVQTQEQNTIEQLTSGYRINSSADDAAGLAIANSLEAEQTELTQGVANGNDGVSQLQIIDGGLTNISTILDRLQTLATEAGSTTFTGDFNTLNSEFQSDLTELNRQASNIGLNTGGEFNENQAVYVGGGIGNQNGAQIGTAIENINLGNASVTQSAISATGSYSGSFTQLTETTAAGYTATSAGNTSVSFSGTSGFSALGATTSAALGATVSASTSSVSTNFTVTQSAVTATYFNSVDAYSLGLATGTAATAATNIAVTNVTSAQAAIIAIAQAVVNLGTVQGSVGAGINQLNFAIGLAQSQITNYASDQSQIRDADIATDASNLSREQVLSQAGIAALAQANQMPQAVLKLLQ